MGDDGVGKTSLLRNSNCYLVEKDNEPTIGVNFWTRDIQLSNKKVKLVIWKLKSSFKFDSYRHLYYKDAEGIILIYDITKQDSFRNLEKLLSDALKYTARDTQIVILGNKMDLKEKRAIPTSLGKKYAKKKNAVLFSEINANTGENVKDLFSILVKNILKFY